GLRVAGVELSEEQIARRLIGLHAQKAPQRENGFVLARRAVADGCHQRTDSRSLRRSAKRVGGFATNHDLAALERADERRRDARALDRTERVGRRRGARLVTFERASELVDHGLAAEAAELADGDPLDLRVGILRRLFETLERATIAKSLDGVG